MEGARAKVAAIHLRLAEYYVRVRNLHKSELFSRLALRSLLTNDGYAGRGYFFEARAQVLALHKKPHLALQAFSKAIDYYSSDSRFELVKKNALKTFLAFLDENGYHDKAGKVRQELFILETGIQNIIDLPGQGHGSI